MPLASEPPARPETARGCSRTAASVAKRPLDRGHDPLVRVEEATVHLRPAVEAPFLRIDPEEARRLYKLVALRGALDNRPVALVRECLLGGGRPEVLVERLRGRLLEPGLGERSGRRDQ